jgi:hypothetical protein
MAELTEGWAAKTSSSTGRTYYLNEYTKATQWEKPEPVAPGQVSLLTSFPGPFLLLSKGLVTRLGRYKSKNGGIWKFI